MGTAVRLTRQQRRALARARRKALTGALASGAALTLGAAFAAGSPAQAATFTVSNLDDAGPGSLRQAIADANADAAADVIDFQAGLTGAIGLTSGQLAITESVDVQGPGAGALVVSGSGSSRVFYLYNGSSVLDVTISGLTIVGGSAAAGAGILNRGESLTLDGVIVHGNITMGDAMGDGSGAGVWADGSEMSLSILDSTLSGNIASGNGGGLYVGDTGGPLLIRGSVVTGNEAAGNGGGIYFGSPDHSLTIEDSTVSDNNAAGAGGGAFVGSTAGGPHTIRVSTFSGNLAAEGGGLFLAAASDSWVLESSTISGNQAMVGDGGGVYLYNLTGGLAIEHSTIAGNSAAGTGGGLFAAQCIVDLDHTIVGDDTAGTNADLGGDGSFDASFSLIESPGTATVNDNGGNVFNQDPQLGPLANSGGSTSTHEPANTSPAVNAGNPAFAPPPAADQRGFPRVANGRIDIGSVEIDAGTIQLTVSGLAVAEGAGTVTVTATRTGGTDGAVTVSYSTADGTATQPGDYLPAAGTLLWVTGDSAPKSFTVTIVDDAIDEPNETFLAMISNPQGGADLGSPTTAVVTIVDDDDAASSMEEVPTLGDAGKILLAGLFGLGGVLLLGRRRSGLGQR